MTDSNNSLDFAVYDFRQSPDATQNIPPGFYWTAATPDIVAERDMHEALYYGPFDSENAATAAARESIKLIFGEVDRKILELIPPNQLPQA